jgi:hypothetical protein
LGSYVTSSSLTSTLSGYLTTSSASSTYQSIANMPNLNSTNVHGVFHNVDYSDGSVQAVAIFDRDVNVLGYLNLGNFTSETGGIIQFSIGGVIYQITQSQLLQLQNTLLTTATASSTYQTIAGMSSYLTTATASSTYQTIAGMSSYLTTATASSTYQTIAGMSSYVTNSSLTTTLASYVTNSSLTSTLASYVTNSSLTSTLASYVTNSSLTSTLASYVTNSSLTTTLASYVTNSSLTTTLASYPSLSGNNNFTGTNTLAGINVKSYTPYVFSVTATSYTLNPDISWYILNPSSSMTFNFQVLANSYTSTIYEFRIINSSSVLFNTGAGSFITTLSNNSVSSLNSSSNNYFKFMYIYSGNFMLLDYH